MVEKVTKEERMATLMKQAAEKAIEILNANDFNEDDLSGEDVKVKKPKAEKVADAKGGDEQADNRTSRDVKKAMENLDSHGECEVPTCSRPAEMVCRFHGGGLCRVHYQRLSMQEPSEMHDWVPIKDDSPYKR